MEHVYVGDHGFVLPFPVKFDMTSMTSMRMLIKQAAEPVGVFDFALSDFNTLNVGDTLNYVVRPTDLTVPGKTQFQVVAKNATVQIAFDPYELEVKRKAKADPWA